MADVAIGAFALENRQGNYWKFLKYKVRMRATTLQEPKKKKKNSKKKKKKKKKCQTHKNPFNEQTDEFYKPSSKNYIWYTKDKGESFVVCEIVKDDKKQYTISVPDGGEVKVDNNENTWLKNPAKFDGAEDNGELPYLNEPAVLHNLKVRYDQDLFYTSSGLFLVAINPYKRLPIYTDEIIALYKGRRRAEIAPHIFALADEAYRNMLENRQNQSMLITGESGAGKTENTKKVIQYLTTVAGKGGGVGLLEEQLLGANPILEALANAKTMRNDNSSRFGKFIEIQFNAAGYINGAVISVYLLEKSRTVQVAKDERTFHIFYQLIEGASKELNAKLHLGKVGDYKYLTQSGCTTVPGVSDKAEYDVLKKALDTYKIDAEGQESIFRVVASILRLGNIEFKGDKASIANQKEVGYVADLLQVNQQELDDALCKPKIRAGGEVVATHLSAEKAGDSRDALAKSLHHRLFLWLVKKINKTLCQEVKTTFIGVLDISGFEIFGENSLEQLLINYTNEKLQQFFNHHMFTLEQEEYEREKIEWNFIDFGMDSEPVISLIEGKPLGILSLLDEECHLGKVERGDQNFLQKLNTNFKTHAKFKQPRIKTEGFLINHYAGDVDYSLGVWLEKNRDPLQDSLTNAMLASTNRFVQRLFEPGALPIAGDSGRSGAAAGRKKGAQFITVAAQHREQLLSLMTTLRSTYPHFVRCMAAGTPVTLADGTSRRIEELVPLANAGAKFAVFSSEETAKRAANGEAKSVRASIAKVNAGADNGVRACVTLTLQDGRTITCTPDHRIRLESGRWVQAQHLKASDRVAVGIDAPLDTIGADEAAFSWQCAGRTFAMASPAERAETLALARVLGAGNASGELRARTLLDKQAMLADLALLGADYVVLPGEVVHVRGALGAALSGAVLPTGAPLAVKREFLAAQLGASERDDAQSVAAQLVECGVKSGASLDSLEFSERVGFRYNVQKQLRLSASCVNQRAKSAAAFDAASLVVEPSSSTMPTLSLAVVSTADAGALPVYDLSVPGLRSFFANGVAVHNCIIPNHTKRPNSINDKMVLEQLRCNGVLEGIRIARKGYPNRIVYPEFLKRYYLLDSEGKIPRKASDPKAAVEKLMSTSPLNTIDKEKFRFGLTKIFFKSGALGTIEEMRESKVSHLVLTVQAACRGYLARRKYRIMHSQTDAASAIQANIRAWIRFKKWGWWKMFTKARPLLKRRNIEKEIEDRDRAINELKANLQRETDAKSKLDGSIRELQDRINQLQEALSTTRDEATAATDAKNSLQRDNQALQDELDKLKADLDALDVQLTESKKAARVSAEKLAELEDDLEDAKKAKDRLEEVRKQLEQDLKTAHGETDAALAKVAALEKSNAALKREIDDMESSLGNSDQAKANLEKYRKELEGNLDDANEKLDECTKARANLDRDLKKALSDLADAKKRMEAEIKARADVEAADRKLTQELNEVKAAGEKAQKELDAANKTLKAQKTELDGVRVDLDAAQQARSALDKAKKSAQNEIDLLKSQLKDEGADKQSVFAAKRAQEMAVEKLQGQLDDAEANVGKLTKLRAAYEAEIEDLKDQIDAEKAAKEAAEAQKRKLATELEEVEDALDAMTADKASLGGNVTRFESQIAELRKELDGSGEARVKLEADKRRLEGELAALTDAVAAEKANTEAALKAKKTVEAQVDELNKLLDEESRGKANVAKSRKAAEAQLEELKIQLQEETADRQKEAALKLQREKELEEITAKHALEVAAKAKATEQLRALQRELQEAQEELEESQTRGGSSDKAAKRLQAELDDLRDQLDAEAKNRVNNDRLRQKLEQTNADLTAKLENRTISQNALELSVRTLQAELDELREQLEAEATGKDTLAKKKKSADAQLEEFASKHDDLEQQKQKLERQKRDLEQQVEELKEQLEGAESSEVAQAMKRKLDLELQAANDRVKQSEELKLAADEAKRQYQKQVEALQTQLEDEAKLRAKSDAAKKKLEKDHADLEARLDQESAKKKEADKAKATLKREMKEAVAAATESAMIPSAEFRRLEADLEEARQALEKEQLARAGLQNRKKALEDELEDLKEQLEDEVAVKEKNARAKRAAETEIEELKDQLEELEERLLEQEEAARKAGLESEEHRKKHEAELEGRALGEDSKLAIEKELAKVRAAFEEERKAKAEHERVRRRLESEVDDLTARHEVATKSLAKNDKARRALERQVADHKRQLEEEGVTKGETESSVFKLEEELDGLRTKGEALAKQLAAAEKAKLNADEQVITLKEAIDNEARARAKANEARRLLETELEELRDRAEEEEERRLELEQQKSKLDVALEGVKKQAERDALERDSLLDQVKKLERDLAGLRNDHDSKTAAAQQLEAATKGARSEIDELAQRVDAEQKARAKAEKARNATEAANAELRGKLTGLEKARLGVDANTKRLEAEIAKLKQRVADEEIARANFEQDVKKKEAELVTVQADLINAKKRAETLSRKLALFVDLVATEAPRVAADPDEGK
jgi:myosin heavy subunit